MAFPRRTSKLRCKLSTFLVPPYSIEVTLHAHIPQNETSNNSKGGIQIDSVNHNVTIDDFDSILTYQDQSVWDTPDPSAQGYNTTGSPWLRGTFHETTVKGALINLNFTGPALYIFGSTGRSFGSYEVSIDGVVTRLSAYRESVDDVPGLLYAATNLTYAKHSLALRNLGAIAELGDKGGDKFVLDYIESTVQLAPAGATVANVTFEETSPAIRYTGAWGNNTGPFFSGGGTTYTNGDRASFTLSFQGSAIYVLGDKKNDHREYSVVLDDRDPEIYNGVSGCGGAFGLTCEQQIPTIKYFASNLDGSNHTLTLTNLAGANRSFFDLDSIVVTVPSRYEPRPLSANSNSTSPFVPSSAGSPSPSQSTGNTPQTGGSAASFPGFCAPLMLLVFSILLLHTGRLRF